LDFFLFMYDFQHCFICRTSDSTGSEDAEIELRTVATTALAIECLHLFWELERPNRGGALRVMPGYF
jgi:hypothetical protein